MDINQLDYELNIQKSNLELLKECLRKINKVIQSKDSFDNSSKITELLKNVKINLDNTKTNISNLTTLKKLICNSKTSSEDSANTQFNNLAKNSQNTISNNFDKECFETLKSTSSIFNEFIIEYIKLSSFSNELLFSENSEKSTISKVYEENDVSQSESTNTNNNNNNEQLGKIVATSEIEEQNALYTDNTLVISEKENKVVLPYTINDLTHILNTDPAYSSLQEIIDDKYTLPLSKYKNAAISRFKETYNLMKKRQKASMADSLDLALELAFNGSLNPAIITACKNLNELDTYLSCAELNELEKFEFFEIKYEISPMKK